MFAFPHVHFPTIKNSMNEKALIHFNGKFLRLNFKKMTDVKFFNGFRSRLGLHKKMRNYKPVGHGKSMRWNLVLNINSLPTFRTKPIKFTKGNSELTAPSSQCVPISEPVRTFAHTFLCAFNLQCSSIRTQFNIFLLFRNMAIFGPSHLFVSNFNHFSLFLLLFTSISTIGHGEEEKTSDCDLGGDDILVQDESVHSCDETNSDNWFIYCGGKLIEAVNYYQILEGNDSKDFVDRPMRKNASEVLELFEENFGKNGSVRDISPKKLRQFLDANFDHAGGELKNCNPEDWMESPPDIERIKDETLRNWAMELNAMWKNLCRVIPDEIKETKDRHSLIYVPNPFIIPGGRFREFYYWDAYWIIKGLIVSGMTDSVRLMIENFLIMVEKFGFVPNGGRIYYSKRSQPPFLTMMVYEYFEATNDYEFIRRAVPILEKELQFWSKERKIELNLNGEKYTMFQYRTESNVPRPESFCQDVKLVRQKTKPEEKRRIWKDVASAAESGWDFSSRWMKDPENPNLLEIETTNIVPVDLNAYICGNYEILSHLFLQLGNDTKALEYHNKHYMFREAFQKVFFVQHDRETAGWYDYNLRTKDHNRHFYATIAIPLFTRCYHSIDLQQSERIFRTMERAGVFKEPGGIPTRWDFVQGHYVQIRINDGVPASMIQSEQQWDYPNGWPPLNHMIIEGLRRSDNKLMQKKAFWLATKWVLSNYRVYQNDLPHGKMWEKYEVNNFKPNKGVGGEYEVQAGFGWTNGVVLDLLTTFGDRMEFKNDLEMNPNAVAKEVINNEPPNLPDPKNSADWTESNALAMNNAPYSYPNQFPVIILACFISAFLF